ncbi:ADP-ribosylation factor-like protein 16 [Stegodyphus dumicola]|uniref:ADP-ribosylation factor-like protein 16 n=1 Tax=Stegodyphus dumicola TaxID=202533 RepID=UPI0015AE028F|nr:ADP-ribosylation factor-like protein 16 [Stegodyphus dumicola]
MIICVGPKGVGKTLLLRRLQQDDIYCDPYDGIFSTIPTVGVNIVKIQVSKKRYVQISELGGSMAAIWPMHFDGCKSVIYVIDVANTQQISCACILLLEMLKNTYLQDSKFIIILNKCDVSSSVCISEVKYLLRLDDISAHALQDIKVIESSCLTGKGINEIKQWLKELPH